MPIKLPNDEQKRAIEHFGGVLLNAGAGSGKTFVLVEHVMHLILSFRQKNIQLGKLEFKKSLRSYLSTIVLMTFTNKAAGELSLRLSKRIRESQEEDPEFWNVVTEAIQSMTVSTIHGFCFKLLSQGHFPGVNPDLEIMDDTKRSKRIENLFQRWLEEDKKKSDKELFKTILSGSVPLLQSMIDIFSDAQLRDAWIKLDCDQIVASDMSDYFSSILDFSDLSDLFLNPPDLSTWDGVKKPPAWHDHIKRFIALANECKLSDRISYERYLEYFESISGKQGPRESAGLPEIRAYWEQIKGLKDFVQKNQEDFQAYFEHGPMAMKAWVKKFKDAFDSINETYDELTGLSFADLEFRVLKGLEDKETVQRIARSYQYFIIDEFQDTSGVQYEILNRLTAHDFNKMFCVGDMKQAIYGFRGGELEVFKDCQARALKNSMSLRNNYRSHSRIVAFNNSLFSIILNRAFAFEGLDRFAVPSEGQKSPERPANDDYAKVLKLNWDVAVPEAENSYKPTVAEMDSCEADAILHLIKKIRSERPTDKICILYSKLNASHFLVEKLLSLGESFTAQIKVPLDQDPVIGMFRILLDSLLEHRRTTMAKSNGEKYVRIILMTYFDLLGIKIKSDFTTAIHSFWNQSHTIGIMESYKKFLYDLAVSNSFQDINLKKLEAICKTANEDLERIIQLLKKEGGYKYSAEFQNGTRPESLILMTAHGSKGLEFDHVIMAGIHNNGSAQPNRDYQGKYPGSFRWKLNSAQKKPFKTPEFIREEIIEKQKEFSEAKRLFYVACTRAIRGLWWVDLRFGGLPAARGKNNWINALRVFESEIQGRGEKLFEEQSEASGKLKSQEEDDDSDAAKTPLFHRDSMGMVDRVTGQKQSVSNLGFTSELSVTRLATIAQCPRKFYLMNICKLDPDLRLAERIDPKIMSEKPELGDIEENDLKMNSSMERGTKLHKMIAAGIQGKLPEEKLPVRDQSAVDWALKNAKGYEKTHSSISEVPIKFSFFGQMISGTPDLILKPLQKSSITHIWDFKTGKRKPESEESYWFQLLTYGYSTYLLGDLGHDQKIIISLLYIDQQEIVSRELSFSEVEQSLSREWKKLGQLDQVNRAHCSACAYENICLV